MGHYNSEIELVFPSPPYAIPILAVNYSFHNGTNMHLSGELSYQLYLRKRRLIIRHPCCRLCQKERQPSLYCQSEGCYPSVDSAHSLSTRAIHSRFFAIVSLMAAIASSRVLYFIAVMMYYVLLFGCKNTKKY